MPRPRPQIMMARRMAEFARFVKEATYDTVLVDPKSEHYDADWARRLAAYWVDNGRRQINAMLDDVQSELRMVIESERK